MPEIKSFVPMTGRGAFDAAYLDGTGAMVITVKVFPNYENRVIEGVSWSETDKVKFELAAKSAVSEHWNYKHHLVNRKKNPMRRVAVLFNVQFVRTRSEATVIMNVPRYSSAYGPGELARCDSYVGLSQIDSGNIAAQSTAMVHSESTGLVNVKLTEAGNVSRDERRRIEALFPPLGLDAMALNPHGVLTPQVKVDLANLGFRIKTGPPSRPLVPLVVKARYSAANGASAGKVVKQMRAVRDQLLAFGVCNPVSVDPSPLNDLNLPGAGSIGLECDLAFETTFDDDMWMNIFAHEYGHMLGLPDEYDAPPAPGDTSSKAIAIRRFLAMCQVHDATKPAMGMMTTSIMCKGRDILPCHMLPALEAMTRITNEEGWTVG
ncbi:hypothetical protein LDO26_06545 [Luteimonas sp. BDR2-5]|uniref:immune inhibitor A domain-containing protein n=1 Tax=Proluteimonas luteida TaxID=2878685 RepID=UPI001E348C75|nr:immune inhibitor A domain-containing protein [Luteimonas sp. BDR2-5]MCD9027862.1 hypothetical protein [Luteimonas sp. BDR2-5]